MSRLAVECDPFWLKFLWQFHDEDSILERKPWLYNVGMVDQSFDSKVTPLSLANPIGWDHNPSAPVSRLPVVVFSFLGLASAHFASTTLEVIARSWIIMFLVGIGLTFAGGTRRWSRAPYLVTATTFVVGPLSLLHALSAILRMGLLGESCWHCLTTVICAALAAGPVAAEVLASFQYVKFQASRGRNPWRAFFGLSPRTRKRGHVEAVETPTRFHPGKG